MAEMPSPSDTDALIRQKCLGVCRSDVVAERGLLQLRLSMSKEDVFGRRGLGLCSDLLSISKVSVRPDRPAAR